MMRNVCVNTEWGLLQEVIVGTAEGLTVPEWTNEYEFVPPEEQDFVRLHGGELLKYAAPERLARIEDQLNGLVNTLNELDIIVHKPRPFNHDETQYLANIRNCSQLLFPRDPILIVDKHVIETAMRDPAERKNRWPLRDIFFQELAGYAFEYVAMPEPQPVINNEGFGPGPFLEGGDVLLCGNEIFIGLSGHASNELGIQWLQNYLGSSYLIHSVPLSSRVLHLDCALCIPRPGLAIYCPDAFIDGLPSYFKGWQLIEVTLEEASYLACNGLVIDSKRIICGTEHLRIINALESVGHEVIGLPFDAVSQFGGAFRCAHHPIRRLNE